MKANVANKWVAALESGKYIRGEGALRTRNDEYCCLGVLCDLFHKETGLGKWTDTAEHGFGFHIGEEKAVCYPPDAVREWAGMQSDDGGYNQNEGGQARDTLAADNDRGASFADIAHTIRERADHL